MNDFFINHTLSPCTDHWHQLVLRFTTFLWWVGFQAKYLTFCYICCNQWLLSYIAMCNTLVRAWVWKLIGFTTTPSYIAVFATNCIFHLTVNEFKVFIFMLREMLVLCQMLWERQLIARASDSAQKHQSLVIKYEK